MKTFDLCKEYCIGCGLCKSELHADMKKNAKGFWFPNLQNNEKTERFLEHVCPIADNCLNEQNIDIWGPYIPVSYTHLDVYKRQRQEWGMRYPEEE